MNDMVKIFRLQDTVGSEVNTAQWHLIAARIARQTATIMSEYEHHEGGAVDRSIEELKTRAARQRFNARCCLRSAEYANGKIFLLDIQGVMPLKHYLNGKNFRQWTACSATYNASKLFKGVDPE